MKQVILFLSLLAFSFQGYAKVELPHVLGSNMVLQQQKPIFIWGQAADGERVTVDLKGLQKTVVAKGDGSWSVMFPAQQASFESFDIIVAGENTIRLENILVGEVWLCSGQSNMEYPMQLPKNYKKPDKGEDKTVAELNQPANDRIRLFLVGRPKGKVEDVESQRWQVCNSESLAPFSAAGYFFGKELLSKLEVPIGLISSSWGGSRIEPWTPAEAYRVAGKFNETEKDGQLLIDGDIAGEMFEGMIRPLAPFALRGFLWYQGESNVMFSDAQYGEKQKLLLDSWRQLWKDKNLSFHYVQLAPYSYTKRKDNMDRTAETLPWFWEIQTKSMDDLHAGMVVVTDLVDNLSDIHPSYKWEVGRRLALWALAKDYGKKEVVYSGPQYKKSKVQGNKMLLEFSHVGGGLICEGDQLNWFEIAGADKVFVPAQAVIDGNKLVVSATAIAKPCYVRFAWSESARPNFFNIEGLPALPFRTEKY